MQAAGSGDRNAALVKLLLEHGASVNPKTGDTAEVIKNGPIALGHLTALQLAACQGNLEAVEALVNAGAEVNAKDVRGATALVFAVATDHANPKIVELLLAKGGEREPALDWALRYQNPAIVRIFGLGPTKPTTIPARHPGPDLRQVIAKALAVSQGPAAKFLGTGGCLSCHAQHLNGLAVAAAKPANITANYELENRQAHDTAILRGTIEQQLFQVQDRRRVSIRSSSR